MAEDFELLPGVFWLVSDISPEFNLQADVDFLDTVVPGVYITEILANETADPLAVHPAEVGDVQQFEQEVQAEIVECDRTPGEVSRLEKWDGDLLNISIAWVEHIDDPFGYAAIQSVVLEGLVGVVELVPQAVMHLSIVVPVLAPTQLCW